MHSCLELNQALVEYRHRPVLAQLFTVGNKHSMLHLDVLALLYHFALSAPGEILEIGPYVGGSTIALAMGVQASERPARKVITVEGGGQHLTHPTLPSDDILRDLKRNLLKRGVSASVEIVEGRSDEPKIGERLRRIFAPGSVGLFCLDADGGVQRDLELFDDLLSADCLLVVDDYYAPGSSKAGPTQEAIDALVAAGKVESYGLYGYGTWFGRRAAAVR